MRIAWFSPLPPSGTGIAAYSADVLPLLEASGLSIDRYEEINAHNFVWRHRLSPYDLVVYQLGNSRWHDYIWGYLFHYPGLTVLHDARLLHARSAQLLTARRIDDYRREFTFNHPETSPAAAEYALEGLRGSPFYFWPMVRAVVESARMVAVHNEFVAAELREKYPDARIERIRLGVPPLAAAFGARDRIRRALQIPRESIVFVAFGLMTQEKRIEPILRAFEAMKQGTAGAEAPHLLLVGANELTSLDALVRTPQLADRVHVTGYVADELIADYLAAADVGLSLRWPTAEETSASWVRSLALSKPTIITSLPHTANVPSLDARTWRPTRWSTDPIAVSVDLLDEDSTLLAAMSRLAEDAELRDRLGRAAHAYWAREHHVDLMADDYRRVITSAAATRAPSPQRLPEHLTTDYGERAASIAREIGVEL
jgi:glycosyltransferase involved in cell wall biosynthesis